MRQAAPKLVLYYERSGLCMATARPLYHDWCLLRSHEANGRVQLGSQNTFETVGKPVQSFVLWLSQEQFLLMEYFYCSYLKPMFLWPSSCGCHINACWLVQITNVKKHYTSCFPSNKPHCFLMDMHCCKTDYPFHWFIQWDMLVFYLLEIYCN